MSIVRAFLTMLGVSLLIFLLVRLSGSPLDTLLPDTATDEARARIATLWGLDRPLPEQYLVFIGNAAQGDVGPSFRYPGQSAAGLIAARFPATLQLATMGLAFSIVVALPIGVLSAVKRNGPVDKFAKGVALIGQSVPSFWLGIVLIWIVSVSLGWLPTSGRRSVSSIILPAFVLSTFGIAALIRLLRSSMLEVLDSEYVKLARIKGVSKRVVIWKHALKNAAVAPLTFFGTVVVHFITGSVVIETVFAWPGIGLLAVQATEARDYHVVQAVALFGAALLVLMNLAVDIIYGYLDPRVRLGKAAMR